MPRSARKPATARKPAAGRKGAAPRKPIGLGSVTPLPKGVAVDPQCYLTLGSGWAHQDTGTPIASVVRIGSWLAHVSLRLKVKTAATASWDQVASIPDWHYRPESVRANLPCAVRDASANAWYMALCKVTGGGAISVTNVGASGDGSLGTPFPLEANDEVHVNVTYFNT